MSRLDRHVAAVQNKLAMMRFVTSLSWALGAAALVVMLAVLIERVFALSIPQRMPIFYGVAGASLLTAIVWAMVTRPSAKLAAVAIDQKLGLKEKISTALFMRSSRDEFAQLAVRDAEKTAENVALNLRQHFPMQFPKSGYYTLGLMVSAFLVASFMPTLDLFGNAEDQKKQAQVLAQQKSAEQAVKRVLAAVEAQPKSMQDNEAVKNAKITLENLLKQGVKDPAQASRTALQAAQEVQDALKKEAMKNAKFAVAQDEAQRRKNLMPAPEDKGSVAEAQREMAKGNFSEAMNKLNDVASKFDQMDKKDQEKAAEQMKNLAKQLEQMAQQQQQQQQQNQQQLQQMGANQQQAQQMQNLMQQAAQGNQQAQQQLQQQMQQMMQQMNNGQGPTPQQQQAMQQAMQQMQQQANGAMTAQQMSQAAQAMAQAMQNAAQGGGQQAGNQNMQQAMQQMQQQLQEMEAASADAQQVQAAQQAMQDAANQAAGACNGQGDGDGQQAGNGGNGQWKAGDINRKGGDGKGGGAGQAFGQRSGPEQAPFATKQEISKSQDNAAGKLLAANYIKDNAPLKGDAKESLKEVAAAAEKEAAEEVDQERVSRQAAKAVKDYFGSLGEEGQSEAPKKE